MKKIFLIIFLLISVSALTQIDKIVPAKPPVSAGFVHDFAGILTDEQEHSIEEKLNTYDASTSNQIAIVTLPTLIDKQTGTLYEDEEVALKILRDWGVGQKDRNNGIVILIVKSNDDKEKKIRIEVGYGLEGAITDIISKRIIENEIAPAFREKNYYRGLTDATDAIIKAAAGEYKAPEGYRKGKKGLKFWQIISLVFIIWIGLGIFSGGNRGGGGYVSRRGWMGPTIGGGGWSGGGWSGGGGGGFGGFGGGGGGGGGSSGSW